MNWRQPPLGARINTAHPLARGYKNGVVLQTTSAQWQRPFAGVRTIEGAPALTAVHGGAGVAFDGGTDLWWWDAAPYPGGTLGPVTLAVGFSTRATPSYGDMLATLAHSGGATNPYLRLGIRLDNGAGTAHVTLRDDAADTHIAESTTNVGNDGSPHIFATTVVGAVNPGFFLYIDGIPQGSGSFSLVGWGIFSFDRFSIGGLRDSASGNTAPVTIHFVHIWERALRQDELQLLQIDPYAFFVRPRRRAYRIPTAPSGMAVRPSMSGHMQILAGNIL